MCANSDWIPSGLEPAAGDLLAAWEAAAQSWRAECFRVLEREPENPYVLWSPYNAENDGLHEVQAKIWYDRVGLLIWYASNRNGKTECGSALDILTGTCVPPLWFTDPCRVPYLGYMRFPNQDKLPPVVIVAGPHARTREEGIGKRISEMAPNRWIKELRRDALRRLEKVIFKPSITRGGEIWFVSQQQGQRAAMAVDVDEIHWDEEPEGEAGDGFRFGLKARLGDRGGRERLMFTAEDSAKRGGNTPIVTEIVRPHVLGELSPEVQKNISVYHSTAFDNPFWDPVARYNWACTFLSPPVATGQVTQRYRLHVLGEIVGLGVSPVFDPGALEHQQKLTRPPIAIGELYDATDWEQRGAGMGAVPPKPEDMQVNFAHKPDGMLRIHEFPIAGEDYIVAMDNGHGTTGGNPTAMVVLRRSTMGVAALVHGLIPPALAQSQGLTLAAFYNEAWLIVEAADQGVAVVSWLAGMDCGEVRWPWLYQHIKPGKDPEVERGMRGYPMNGATKPYMIAKIKEALLPPDIKDWEDVELLIRDTIIVEDLSSFQYDTKTKAGPPKMVQAKIPMGEMVRHGDAGVAIGLALVAHHSTTCPMRFPDPIQKVFKREVDRRANDFVTKMSGAARVRRVGLGMEQIVAGIDRTRGWGSRHRRAL